MQYTGCSMVVSKSQIFSVVGFKTKIIFLAFFFCLGLHCAVHAVRTLCLTACYFALVFTEN